MLLSVPSVRRKQFASGLCFSLNLSTPREATLFEAAPWGLRRYRTSISQLGVSSCVLIVQPSYPHKLLVVFLYGFLTCVCLLILLAQFPCLLCWLVVETPPRWMLVLFWGSSMIITAHFLDSALPPTCPKPQWKLMNWVRVPLSSSWLFGPRFSGGFAHGFNGHSNREHILKSFQTW